MEISRAHDVGGALDAGALEPQDDTQPFHHEWEARVFAVNRMLLQRGVYTLDEFRYAIEQINPAEYRAASYYERWLIAIEALLRAKGVAQ
jgi:nitrile hydratase